jgi:hypothetical protein
LIHNALIGNADHARRTFLRIGTPAAVGVLIHNALIGNADHAHCTLLRIGAPAAVGVLIHNALIGNADHACGALLRVGAPTAIKSPFALAGDTGQSLHAADATRTTVRQIGRDIDLAAVRAVAIAVGPS